MKLVDTHTHLYLKEFSGDIADVMSRAELEGVEKFYLPAIDSSETASLLALERKFPGKCFAMAGLHPCSVKANYGEELDKVREALEEREFAAIGEAGLDFYWDTSFMKEQYLSLRTQAGWAVQHKLPLVLHTRNATQETIDVIKEYSGTGLKGIFHCFSGTPQNATDITALGFLLGIGGVLTYKNSGLADVIKNIGLEHLVLETDAPYLTPVPFRGKRNESSYLKYIVQKIAEIKDISPEEVADQTSKNAGEIFRYQGNGFA